MPKLWDQTIESHRHAIREAVLDAAEAEVAAHGMARATMTRIAERAGIGRATLYKYFADVPAIVTAAHTRHVEAHLVRLTELGDLEAPIAERLRLVASEYARICYHRARHGDADLSALVHRSSEVELAEHRLSQLFATMLTDAQRSGEVRSDIAPGVLASYCLHALAAAGRGVDTTPSGRGIDQIVQLTLDGLRPSSQDREDVRQSGG